MNGYCVKRAKLKQMHLELSLIKFYLMKKAFLLIGVLALALGITYLVLHKSGSAAGMAEVKDSPLSVSAKSSGFNRSFAEVMNSYYHLADVFNSADTSQISAAALGLKKAVDSIRFDQFKADSSITLTAVSVAQSVQGEVLGLIGEKAMEQKKREFNLITEDLYSLIRVVRYDGGVIYHMRCTTAFPDSSEAYWLSASNQIVNPYLDKNHNMPDNAEVSDSLRFSVQAGE
jgi:hypothetical protein